MSQLVPIVTPSRVPAQYRRISANCHLDMPWMPPELFVSEASREMKDRMPYVTEGPDGPMWVTNASQSWRVVSFGF